MMIYTVGPGSVTGQALATGTQGQSLRTVCIQNQPASRPPPKPTPSRSTPPPSPPPRTRSSSRSPRSRSPSSDALLYLTQLYQPEVVRYPCRRREAGGRRRRRAKASRGKPPASPITAADTLRQPASQPAIAPPRSRRRRRRREPPAGTDFGDVGSSRNCSPFFRRPRCRRCGRRRRGCRCRDDLLSGGDTARITNERVVEDGVPLHRRLS